MDEKTIELGIISTAGFEHLSLGGHGTGGNGTPGFRKLSEEEVKELVFLLLSTFTWGIEDFWFDVCSFCFL